MILQECYSKRVFTSRPRAILRAWTMVWFVGSLAGCAHLPDAKVSYYQAKTLVTIKVVRSILCDSKNSPLVANTVTPTASHIADFSKPQSLQLKGVRSTFTDSDFKFEFYEDGRLKSINATQTGEAEAILKAATTVASTLYGFTTDTPKTAFQDECQFVKEIGGGKPLTITYEGSFDPLKEGPQIIPSDAASAPYAARLGKMIGDICAVASGSAVPIPPITHAPNSGDIVIVARQPAMLQLAVGEVRPENQCSETLWKGRVPVAQLGLEYKLPVPRAALLGKEVFSAAFVESGALSSVQYSSNSGGAGAMGATNSLAALLQGESTSSKVGEVKAEADLIAQQQRLVQCKADPTNCK